MQEASLRISSSKGTANSNNSSTNGKPMQYVPIFQEQRESPSQHRIVQEYIPPENIHEKSEAEAQPFETVAKKAPFKKKIEIIVPDDEQPLIDE